MIGSSRRIYLYWLLLLLPTLAVGAGAIQLLRREQARLSEQAAVVDTARLAAVEARSRLVAESVELLVWGKPHTSASAESLPGSSLRCCVQLTSRAANGGSGSRIVRLVLAK